ncbi:HAD hydrolase-like protein [Intestinibacillus massiliensis]|uniref:YqeG family HAD IIIA-type phosphatase n=1 Tax=Intestinibacillus massiliensis TaxID=1871029 RepID=UPI0013563F14|nr:HAD family hydrolase [Intestinibacillus massiliensis]MCB6367071.1 HAD hydrolase-like protein [Intestinibacillus massiliensis]
MSKLIPTYVFESIYEITPALLQGHGARGMLIDLDGTMASRHDATPPDTLRPFLHSFLDAGIEVLVLSNNNERRVQVFCEGLDVPWLSRAGKPFRRGFQRGAAVLGVPISECAVVGDQIYTDTCGGNRAGAAATCYVRSLDLKDFWINLRYQFERGFIARGKKQMEARKK